VKFLLVVHIFILIAMIQLYESLNTVHLLYIIIILYYYCIVLLLYCIIIILYYYMIQIVCGVLWPRNYKLHSDSLASWSIQPTRQYSTTSPACSYL